MKMTYMLIALLGLTLYSCAPESYNSESLQVYEVAKNTYVHVSYLETEDFGKVACNGMIVVNNKEAVIFDTPVQNSTSEELIHWVEDKLNCQVIGVVATHFHNDCLGGLEAFHKKGIRSHAYYKTVERAKTEGLIAPQISFNDKLKFKLGKANMECLFLGEGHTADNIVCYYPKEKVLFGGCLIKALKAKKGYLGDANVESWPSTVGKVKDRFDEVEVVIPGHGEVGGKELLDYTIQLFEAN